MALTLDGTTPMPNFGGSGSGIGALGGGVAGLLLGSMLNGGGLFGGGYGHGYGAAPATTAVASDIVLNPAFQSLQNQIQTLSAAGSTNAVQDQLQDLAIAQQQTSAAVNTNIDAVTRDLLNGQAAVQTAQAANNYTTLTSINGLGNQITAAQNQGALQNLNSFNGLTTTTLEGFNSSAAAAAQTQLQNLNAFNNQTVTMLQGFNSNANAVQNSTNQIIAQGNAAAMAQAECCCAIKSLITSDGNTTRQLINDLNVQNLRDQLAAANNQVSNYQQNQFLIANLKGSIVV